MATKSATHVSVGKTATQLVGANAERVSIKITPLNGNIYIGASNAVTRTTGYPLKQGVEWADLLPAGDAIWAISAEAGVDVRVLEVAGDSPLQLAISGVTASSAEINVLDSATATTADLNKLAAVTATAAELNKMDGIAAGAVPVLSERVSFTETSVAGTYTGSVTVPAGALIEDIKVWSTVLWAAATSADMDVGDAGDPNGWFAGISVKATDLAVGEEINFENPGGKAGAYLDVAVGKRAAAYSASQRVVSGIIVTVTTAGATAGRTFMEVLYSLPTAVAATKV